MIYDAHEYETQRNGLKGLRQVYIKIKEKFLIKFCDGVITVGDTIANEYVRLYSIKKPLVIYNCPILKLDKPVKNNLFHKAFNFHNSDKVLLYQGYLYPGRGIEILLEAFSRIQLKNYKLVFMGEGSLERMIHNQGDYGKTIFHHPFVSGDVLLNYTSSADYGITFIEDISLSDRYCLPNKLFEYIAAGLPVIGSGMPDLSRFINENKIGVTSKTNDVEGFINALHDIFHKDRIEMGQNILRARNLYNWNTQEKKLINFYKELAL